MLLFRIKRAKLFLVPDATSREGKQRKQQRDLKRGDMSGM
jgi:hypothetical protein